MLPAYLGDALWIEYGDPERPNRILIDGGLVGTADVIKSKIEAVAEKEGGRCYIELMVVTHIDADHIEGIIKLLGDAGVRLDIGDVWFNGAKHLPEPNGENENEFLGARQGDFLSLILRKRKLPWNRMWDGKTIFVPSDVHGDLPRRTLPGGMEIVLLSPTFDKLKKLSQEWEIEIQTAGLDGASDAEILAALQRDRKLALEDEFLGEDDALDITRLQQERARFDASPANGSSIAFLASFKGRHCLLGGDAHTPILAESIKRIHGGRDEQEALVLDAFKVPHHGSRNNLHTDLLRSISCRRFLISTDGSRFHHPDRQAIARLIAGDWRKDAKNDAIHLYFNYRSEYNRIWDDDVLKTKWNYVTHYPEGNNEGFDFLV